MPNLYITDTTKPVQVTITDTNPKVLLSSFPSSIPAIASSISFTPYSTISSTNVQNAIQELLDEISAGGGHVIKNNGTSLTARSGLNFVGSGITASDDSINNETDVTLNTNLNVISSLSPVNDDFLQYKSGAWANRTIAQIKTDLGLSGTNSGDQTSIVGITGTLAQFNAAVTDADLARTDASNTFVGVQNMTSPAITTSITTPSTSFSIANTTATTGNLFGAATTLNIGVTASGTVTHNYSTASTTSGNTKSINIGTNGLVGSTTNIIIGEANGGTTYFASPTVNAPRGYTAGTSGFLLGTIKLFGSTSGDVTLQPNAVAGTGIILTLPATTGTLVTGGGTASGTNTGDQTSIVGITGTKAQFNTAVTDGDILYVGDAPSGSGGSNQVAYWTSASTLGALSSVNSGTLVTDGSGVPSLSTTLPTTVQSNITQLGTLTTDVNFATNQKVGTTTANSLTLKTNSSDRLTISATGEQTYTQNSRSSAHTFLTYTQNNHTGSSPVFATWTGGAHTTLAASTEATDINFNLGRTVQFSTGALATQRAFRIQAPTYSFVGSSTITTAATVSISGAPIAGTNATITNSYALNVESGASLFNGLVNINNSATFGASEVLNVGGHAGFRNSSLTYVDLMFANSGGTAGQLRAYATKWELNSDRYIFYNKASSTNFLDLNALGLNEAYVPNKLVVGGNTVTTALVNFTQPVATSGSPTGILFTGGAHTTLTAATEAIDVHFNLNRTVQFTGGGPFGAQRAIKITAPTYSATSSTTITNAITVSISGAPSAGTNMTLTSPTAFAVESGASVFLGRTTFGGATYGGTSNIANHFKVVSTSDLFVSWFDGSTLTNGSTLQVSGQTAAGGWVKNNFNYSNSAIIAYAAGSATSAISSRIAHASAVGLDITTGNFESVNNYNQVMARIAYAPSTMTATNTASMLYIGRKATVGLGGFDMTGAMIELEQGSATTGDFISALGPSTALRFRVNYEGKLFTAAPANNDALTQILARDGTTGEIKYRDASTLSGGGGASFGLLFKVSTLRL